MSIKLVTITYFTTVKMLSSGMETLIYNFFLIILFYRYRST